MRIVRPTGDAAINGLGVVEQVEQEEGQEPQGELLHLRRRGRLYAQQGAECGGGGLAGGTTGEVNGP